MSNAQVAADISALMDSYASTHFVDFESIIRRSGADEATVVALIDAGAAPGVVYVKTPDGNWWSALGAYVGREDETPPQGNSFYSPASVWWIRRALLSLRSGLTPNQAARVCKDKFIGGFADLIGQVEGAELAYPECFKNGVVLDEQVTASAVREWGAWVQGAYAVCLRRFSARSCIEKEALRAQIVATVDVPSSDAKLLFDRVEKLEALVLPFAPHERPNGAPGKAIDAPLWQLNLGVEEPYQR